MEQWIENHELLLGWLTLGSLAVFIGTLVLVPWLAARIPADYFTHGRRHKGPLSDEHPALRILLMAGKNLLGILVIAAGLVMLVLPGQGLLTLFLGVLLLDFPGKYRLERWVVSRGPVLRTVNRLRRRAGRRPLEM
ncbi:MAG: PGPGW domain-containing protein [Thermodesulfobacteriota bacterium]|nr:PGPGW domain-containing protein [Thermodesulfobacteriota bacterium]